MSNIKNPFPISPLHPISPSHFVSLIPLLFLSTMFQEPTIPVNLEQREAENLIRVLNQMKASGIFDAEYIEHLKLVFFGSSLEEGSKMVFQGGQMKKDEPQDYDAMDFMTGRRTDFVAINTREDFEEHFTGELNDRQSLPFIFLEGKLCFEEFVAHETAHNMFDIHYKEKEGEYEDIDGITEVSAEYRDRMGELMTGIAKKHIPNLDVSRFELSRQKIAEIYAMLYQREFCRRAGLNEKLHAGIEKRVENFLSRPIEDALARFNTEQDRNCTMEDFYAENHMLSLIIAPAFEKEFPDFKERISLFFPASNK